MKEDQIKIEKIKLGQIDRFAHQALNKPPYQETAPISRRRALSQLNNPYGRPDDVALLVALHDNRCVGYQGLLPGLYCHQGEMKRIHWSTAFFVSADYRGAGIASRLLEEIRALDIDFPVTRMTESARQAYLKSGFKELGHLTYYQLRMEKIRKLNAILQEAGASSGIDPGSDEYLKSISDAHWAGSPFYRRSKDIFYRRLLKNLNSEQPDCEHRTVEQIDARARQIIGKPPDEPCFFRGVEAVNWMLKYRWLISAAHEKVEAEPYYFSLVSELFDYIAVEIYSADRRVFKGFMVLSVLIKKGRTWVKILDFAFEDPADEDLVPYFALLYAKKFNADRLEFPDSLLNSFAHNPMLQPLIKEQQRLYLFYPRQTESVFEGCIGRIGFDYCDADTTFT